MFDSTISEFINKFKVELVRLSEDYITQIMEKEIKYNNEQNLKEMINYIEKTKTNIELKEDFKDNIYKNKENLEINKVIDLLLEIMTLEKNQNLSNYMFRFVRSCLSEMKLFRNLFSHEKNISNEIIQRFFENAYFFFKYIKLPKGNHNRFKDDSSFLNQITFFMNNCLIVNLKNPDAYKLDEFFISDILTNRSKVNIPNFEEDIMYIKEIQNDLDRIFEDKIKQDLYYFNADALKIKNVKNFKFFSEKDSYINDNHKPIHSFSSNRSIGLNPSSLNINAKNYSINSKSVNSFNNENNQEKKEKENTISDFNVSYNVSSSVNINSEKISFSNDSANI